MVKEFSKRKDYAYGRLVRMEGIKCNNVDGAFYLLPDISYYFGKRYGEQQIRDSFDFCNYILNEAHVAIVPGAAFYAPNTVRIAYTNSMDKIVEGMNRIETALRKLK